MDYNTGKQVLQILQDMSRKKGATVVIVTHNSAIAPIADRVIRMHDGKVTAVDVNEHPDGHRGTRMVMSRHAVRHSICEDKGFV